MNKRGWSFLLVLLLSLVAIPLHAETTEVLFGEGPSETRIDVVLLGDGYTESEQDAWHDDAQTFVDTLMQTSPYDEYGAHFILHRVDLISAQSGADHPEQNIEVDTALDAGYGAYGIDRLLVVDDTKALAAAARNVPEYDYVFVVVNDATYGGSGGVLATFSVHELASEIGLHEFGHTFAGLADEYTTPYPGYPAGDYEPNVTYQTERESIPWVEWIVDETPLPTPEESDYDDVVGIFEGARYLETGIYRPVHVHCRMNQLMEPFCPVCTEAHIQAIVLANGILDGPEASELTVDQGQTVTLDPRVIQTTSESIHGRWFVNDEELADEQGATLVVNGWQWEPGNYSITVMLEDESSLITSETRRLTQGEVSFSLTVLDSGEAPDGDVDDTDGDEPDDDDDADDDDDDETGDDDDDDVDDDDNDDDVDETGDDDDDNDVDDDDEGQAWFGSGDSSGCALGSPSWFLLSLFGLALRRKREV